MARLQILELPEVFVGEASETPFVLIVDQYEPPPYPGDINEAAPYDGIAEKIGARAVLVFEDTIEIPANDIPALVDEPFKTSVEEWAAGTNETIARLIDAINGKTKRPNSNPTPRPDGGALPADAHYEMTIDGKPVTWTHADELRARAVDAAQERTDIARDMDRLAKWKNDLTDALGMDPLRDWDDIRNAAAGLRKERDAQAETLERMRAGEEPVTDERVAPTPGQWIWKWNRATPEKRLDMAAQIFNAMPRANTCLLEDHEAQIARLRDELARLRGETAQPDA